MHLRQLVSTTVGLESGFDDVFCIGFPLFVLGLVLGLGLRFTKYGLGLDAEFVKVFNS